MSKISALILVFIALAITINSYKKFNTIHKGKEVEVVIVNIPVSCDVSNKNLKPYFKFSYNGKVYIKNIKGEYCDILKKTKTLKLKTNSDNSVFVYLDESLIMEYVAVIFLLLISVFLLKNQQK
ncbi:hypothetical protein [Seonamhaeicola marinus]|uniref:DUF3592 domain-containing protein n=1 Tax=Seonamhaeicola marinus TaxID=1912246 RepID=A0A5D0HWC3_9FLAO|nr:hypothetical protein [Seonamhaeicola marinus]TYA74819.1 hypothetical protein FUA24_16050 [Seonamhaeicola marinus]